MSGQGNGAGSAILAELASLRADNKALHEKIDRLMAHLGATRSAGTTGNDVARVVSPQDIAGDRGDPKIRMVPKKWTGENYKGSRASQCHPDFLEMYADQLDWFADNPKEGEDPKKAKWDRLDAARCRRWAIEIREGRVKQDKAPDASPTPRSQGEPGRDEWGGGDTTGWGNDNGTF